MACSSIVVILFVVVTLFYFLFCNNLREGFLNYKGAACSVLPPSWIGRVNQGNGRIGDSVLSGFNFYSAV